MDVVRFWFILASYSLKTFAQRCKLTQRSEHGLVLLDHVFKSFTVDRLASCYIACNSQPVCQSLNFRLSDKTCQFNKETKTSCPASLKQNEGFIYADNSDRVENIFKTNFVFLVTSKTEESGKHKVKGISYVMSPLTYKVSRNAKTCASFRQRVLRGN